MPKTVPRRKGDIARDEVEQALAAMPYGLYIVGSVAGDEANGMMADWVSQLSFKPRLVGVALENDSHTLMNIRATSSFTVNLLSADDMALASEFAQPYYGSKIKGRPLSAFTEIHHKLENVPHRRGETGCPILEAATAWVECLVDSLAPAGDHTLVIGRVIGGGVQREAEPLTSMVTGWVYGG